MIKLNKLIALAAISTLLVNPLSVDAASKTIKLKPTKVEVAYSVVTLDQDPNQTVTVGSGVQDPEKILSLDGQVAVLDPEILGPVEQRSNTILMIDYEKEQICGGAEIEDVRINITWRNDGEHQQSYSAAFLVQPERDAEGLPYISVSVDTQTGSGTVQNNLYGGLLPSSITNGGDYSGNPPLVLTTESSSVKILPTFQQLTSNQTFIGVSMGEVFQEEGSEDITKVIGYLDYVELEVTYDGSNCSAPPLDTTSIAPPKTGVALTVFIIAAGSAAAGGSSYLTYRKRKKSKSRSERE
jgi:LPXTG-motif cell wall-anchored protein